jgi:hypothetical protein
VGSSAVRGEDGRKMRTGRMMSVAELTEIGSLATIVDPRPSLCVSLASAATAVTTLWHGATIGQRDGRTRKRD